MPKHRLMGCRPVPLAHYLKSLAVLRLVSEQVDSAARGYFEGDNFVLDTNLEREGLETFFLHRYRPTPIIAPWNGGSGFFKKDNRTAIDAIAASQVQRLAAYRATIEAARLVHGQLRVDEKVAGDEKKQLLTACRNQLSDEALDWLDAAFVLTEGKPKYPPLLGTGGNDGRLDFTNNFMQRLLDVVDAQSGAPSANASSLLAAALFDEPSEALLKNAAIGQFLPSSAGGANASTGISAASLINPWDFVLMLEGALMFAAAVVRKLEHGGPGEMSFPFAVHQAGVGYASASDQDAADARAEMWMPLWEQPASLGELRTLLAEGRATVGGRAARNGVDFARALATLGVDRGIKSFQRYGFQVRNGLAYFAAPLGRHGVRDMKQARLLDELDPWMDRFRRAAGGGEAPASARRALRRLDTAIFELCEHEGTASVQEVLMALGQCEQTMAQSSRWVEKGFLKPIAPLSPEWLFAADDGSTELRLAASLSSIYPVAAASGVRGHRIREQLEPVDVSVRLKGERRLGVKWSENRGPGVVWRQGRLPDVLLALLERRLLIAGRDLGQKHYSDAGVVHPTLDDVARFVEGRVDERRLTELLWGCALLDWPRVAGDSRRLDRSRGSSDDSSLHPGAFYGLLKLCFAGRPLALGAAREEAVKVPMRPEIVRLAMAKRGEAAAEVALRRLRASGMVPAIQRFAVPGNVAWRSAAALLFPLTGPDTRRLQRSLMRPEKMNNAPEEASAQPT